MRASLLQSHRVQSTEAEEGRHFSFFFEWPLDSTFAVP